MEYNEKSFSEKNPKREVLKHKMSGVKSRNYKYRSEGAGGYSNFVEDRYQERKKSGEGKDPTNDTYPLKLIQQ